MARPIEAEFFGSSGFRVGSGSGDAVRIEVELTEVEVDGVSESSAIAVSAGQRFDPLDS